MLDYVNDKITSNTKKDENVKVSVCGRNKYIKLVNKSLPVANLDCLLDHLYQISQKFLNLQI